MDRTDGSDEQDRGVVMARSDPAVPVPVSLLHYALDAARAAEDAATRNLRVWIERRDVTLQQLGNEQTQVDKYRREHSSAASVVTRLKAALTA